MDTVCADTRICWHMHRTSGGTDRSGEEGFVFLPLYSFGTLDYMSILPSKDCSSAALFETPWTVAPQASLSIGFSRQEYWSGLSFPSPEGYCQTWNRTHVSCTGRWILYH